MTKYTSFMKDTIYDFIKYRKASTVGIHLMSCF